MRAAHVHTDLAGMYTSGISCDELREIFIVEVAAEAAEAEK